MMMVMPFPNPIFCYFNTNSTMFSFTNWLLIAYKINLEDSNHWQNSQLVSLNLSWGRGEGNRHRCARLWFCSLLQSRGMETFLYMQSWKLQNLWAKEQLIDQCFLNMYFMSGNMLGKGWNCTMYSNSPCSQCIYCQVWGVWIRNMVLQCNVLRVKIEVFWGSCKVI
jgi:hypothetical protein